MKSQGAAELRMQLIISIYEVLNAKRRHYARVPSLTGRDVLFDEDSFVRVPKNGSTSFGLWLVEKLHNLITEPEIRTSVKTKEILVVKGFRPVIFVFVFKY